MTIRTIKPNEHEIIFEKMETVASSFLPNKTMAQLLASLREEVTYEEDFEVVALENKELLSHGLMTDVALDNQTGYLLVVQLTVFSHNSNNTLKQEMLRELESRALTEGYRGVVLISDKGRESYPGYHRLNTQFASQDTNQPLDFFLKAINMSEKHQEVRTLTLPLCLQS